MAYEQMSKGATHYVGHSFQNKYYSLKSFFLRNCPAI